MREQIERRPALLSAAALILGILTPDYLWLGAAILGLVAVPKSWLTRATVSAFAVLGILISPDSPGMLTDRIEGEVVGTVEAPPKRFEDRTTFVIDSSAGRFIVDAPPTAAPIFGERVRVLGTFRPPAPDAKPYYDRMALRGRVRADEVQTVAAAGPIAKFANSATESFQAYSARWFNAERASLLDALVMGLDAGMAEGLRDDLRNSGTLHLVAASGFQVQLIAAIALFLLRFLPVPRYAQLLIWAALVAIYALMAGLGVSIVRAMLMSCILGGAYLLRRDSDFLSSLGAAAIGILLWRPTALAEIGFQLSFITVAGLGLFASGEAGYLRWREAVRTAAVAFAFSTPIIAYHFGTIQPLAIIANVLVAGLVLPIVVASLFGWVFAGIAGALATPISAWLGWILVVVNWTGLGVSVGEFSAWWLVPVYAAMFAIARLDRREEAPATP